MGIGERPEVYALAGQRKARGESVPEWLKWVRLPELDGRSGANGQGVLRE